MGRHLKVRVVRPKLQPHLAIVKMSGFVNAATVLDFESVLDSLLLEKRLDVVLDFAEITYINSTGISALLTYHQSWRAKGDELVVIRASRSILSVMEQLGVPSVMPVLADEEQAIDLLRRSITGQRVHASHLEFLQKQRDAGKAPPAPVPAAAPAREAAPDKDHSVLVIDPVDSLFAEVLELRYNGAPGRYHLVHGCLEALREFDRIQPDLIVLRDASPQADDFVAKVKIEKKRSLVSIIKIYPKGVQPHNTHSFKIWENDFFVEPFDISELFALAEMELKRVPRDRQIGLHQTVFRFLTNEENIEKAGALMEDLLGRSGLAETDRTSLLAAFKEALDNAWRHGHGGKTDRSVEVLFMVDLDSVTIEVADEGEGFPYGSYLHEIKGEDAYVRAGKTHAQGKRGGLGILLMSRCADELAYLGSGNRLRLRKRFGGTKSAEPSVSDAQAAKSRNA